MRFELVGVKIPKWKPAADRGTWTLSDRRLSNPAKMRKKSWSGQNNLGQNNSLSRYPTHLSHTTNIPLSRIKCERLYFYKEVCSFVHWSSCIMFDYVSAYSCIMDIQQCFRQIGEVQNTQIRRMLTMKLLNLKYKVLNSIWSSN